MATVDPTKPTPADTQPVTVVHAGTQCGGLILLANKIGDVTHRLPFQLEITSLREEDWENARRQVQTMMDRLRSGEDPNTMLVEQRAALQKGVKSK